MVTFAMCIHCVVSLLVKNNPAVVDARDQQLVSSHGAGGSTFHRELIGRLRTDPILRVAFVLFLTFIFVSSLPESLHLSRESSITCQPVPLFAAFASDLFWFLEPPSSRYWFPLASRCIDRCPSLLHAAFSFSHSLITGSGLTLVSHLAWANSRTFASRTVLQFPLSRSDLDSNLFAKFRFLLGPDCSTGSASSQLLCPYLVEGFFQFSQHQLCHRHVGRTTSSGVWPILPRLTVVFFLRLARWSSEDLVIETRFRICVQHHPKGGGEGEGRVSKSAPPKRGKQRKVGPPRVAPPRRVRGGKAAPPNRRGGRAAPPNR